MKDFFDAHAEERQMVVFYAVGGVVLLAVLALIGAAIYALLNLPA